VAVSGAKTEPESEQARGVPNGVSQKALCASRHADLITFRFTNGGIERASLRGCSQFAIIPALVQVDYCDQQKANSYQLFHKLKGRNEASDCHFPSLDQTEGVKSDKLMPDKTINKDTFTRAQKPSYQRPYDNGAAQPDKAYVTGSQVLVCQNHSYREVEKQSECGENRRKHDCSS
jgi:hypothetical protein